MIKTLDDKLSPNNRYCVLDFDEFWEACKPTEDKSYRPWDEIYQVKAIYDKMFPQKRIDPEVQKMILHEVRIRLKKGVQWLRSGSNTNLPIVMLYGDNVATFPTPNNILKVVQRKLGSLNKVVNGTCSSGDCGLSYNGVYVSTDGIPLPNTISYHFLTERELLSELNRLFKIRNFVIENWSNVMINRGKKGFNDSVAFSFFYQMYSPIPGTPALFGHSTIESFLNSLSARVIKKVELIESEYCYVTVKFDLPEIVAGMSLLTLRQFNTIVLQVNRNFIALTRNGDPISDSYFDIVNTVGTSLREPGTNCIAARVVLCFALIMKLVPEIIDVTNSFPAALNVLYHKVCFDMLENRHKTIWIAAGKGSGKSKILSSIKQKGFVVIDSDAYGRLLYQMYCFKANGSGCPYDLASDPLVFARWVYNFIISREFDDSPSLHELLAEQFCKDKSITLELLLADKVPYNTYRDFGYNLTMICSKYIKVQDYLNLIGYIPALVSGDDTANVPTMVVFGHNTLELFAAMTNAIFKMETVFDSLAAVLSRDRASNQVSQLFLAIYYEKMEPLIANAVPAFIIKRALDSLPSYNSIIPNGE